MSKQKQVHTAQKMPSNEALQLSGIRELTGEELFKVNGGRQVEGAVSSYGNDPESSSSSTENDTRYEDDFSDNDDFGSTDSSGWSASSSEIGSSDSSSSSGSSSSYGSDSDDTGGYTDCPEAGYTDYWEGAHSGGYGNSGSSDGFSDNASSSWTFNEGEETSATQGGGSPRTHWTSSSDEASSGSRYSESSDDDYSNSGSSGNSYYTRPAWKTGKNTVEADFNPNAEFEGDSYVVRSGDTLSTIVSKKYPEASEAEIRRLVREVAENSGITNVNRIEVGQTIFFKKPADASASKTKKAETEEKTSSLKERVKNIREAIMWDFITGNKKEKQESGTEIIVQDKNSLKPEDKGVEAVRSKEMQGVTRMIKHNKNMTIGDNTEGKNLQPLTEEVKYIFVQGYSQLEFDKRYKFENNGHTQSCKTMALINGTISKEELGEQKFYSVLDNCVKLWEKNDWIDKDGSPKDLDKMHLSLIKELEKETFWGLEFIKENKDWKPRKLSSDAFVESTAYESGIGFWETADGGKHYMAMKKRDGYIMVIDSMDITRPRASLYTPSTIEPYTQRKVG